LDETIQTFLLSFNSALEPISLILLKNSFAFSINPVIAFAIFFATFLISFQARIADFLMV
jgi:hypothetical protein